MEMFLKELAKKTLGCIGRRMLKEGWETNGVYWWFEDSEQMTFRDALDLWRECLPAPPVEERE